MSGRFVILLHRGHGPTHHDLMLEHGQALATWQFASPPWQAGKDNALPAQRLPDHRLAYLDYEGPVSQGRGEVQRLDAGTFDRHGSAEAEWRVTFHGMKLRGMFRLSDDGDNRWRFEADPTDNVD